MANHTIVYDPEVIWPLIEERLEMGQPLMEICRLDGMPLVRVVYDWIKGDADLLARFARARDIGFDAIAMEAMRIADDATGDYEQRTLKDGQVVRAFDPENVQRSKLRVETRLKLLAKWSPKKYGDAVQLRHADSQGGELPKQPITFVAVYPGQAEPVIEGVARVIEDAREGGDSE